MINSLVLRVIFKYVMYFVHSGSTEDLEIGVASDLRNSAEAANTSKILKDLGNTNKFFKRT